VYLYYRVRRAFVVSCCSYLSQAVILNKRRHTAHHLRILNFAVQKYKLVLFPPNLTISIVSITKPIRVTRCNVKDDSLCAPLVGPSCVSHDGQNRGRSFPIACCVPSRVFRTRCAKLQDLVISIILRKESYKHIPDYRYSRCCEHCSVRARL
jgi:hypothetical protein